MLEQTALDAPHEEIVDEVLAILTRSLAVGLTKRERQQRGPVDADDVPQRGAARVFVVGFQRVENMPLRRRKHVGRLPISPERTVELVRRWWLLTERAATVRRATSDRATPR